MNVGAVTCCLAPINSQQPVSSAQQTSGGLYLPSNPNRSPAKASRPHSTLSAKLNNTGFYGYPPPTSNIQSLSNGTLSCIHEFNNVHLLHSAPSPVPNAPSNFPAPLQNQPLSPSAQKLALNQNKRTRKIACYNCHKHKKKCSTGIICDYCAKLDKECVYPNTPPGTYQTGKHVTPKIQKRQENVIQYQKQRQQESFMAHQQLFTAQHAPQQPANIQPIMQTVHETIMIDDDGDIPMQSLGLVPACALSPVLVGTRPPSSMPQALSLDTTDSNTGAETPELDLAPPTPKSPEIEHINSLSEHESLDAFIKAVGFEAVDFSNDDLQWFDELVSPGLDTKVSSLCTPPTESRLDWEGDLFFRW